MRDGSDGDNIDVRLDDDCGPYIMFAPADIDRIEDLLQKNGIPFMLEDGTNACKGTPEAAVIEFGKGADVARIQRVLDSIQ
ncbi:MAG: hypothetical protein BIFFINMI_04261 [Phycisphaerae bacterium]|nr:hypothetical protein [Phycisphaerae bacterium]